MSTRSFPTTWRCAPGGASVRWRRWRPTTSTSWCWDARPTSGTSPERRSCGSRAPGRSRRSASLVRATGEIHLNSSWDEGIPEEIGHDHLYGLAWNPMTLIEVLKNIDGAATAAPRRNRCAVTDIRSAAADGVPQRGARRRRDRHACRPPRQDRRRDPRTAGRAEGRRGRPGRRGGRTRAGQSPNRRSPASCSRRWPRVVSARRRPRTVRGSHRANIPGGWARRDRRIADGDLVAFASGALANGYVGEVGRTWPVGDVKGADALFGALESTVGQAGCRVSARGAGQRPVRRLRSSR